MPFRGTYYPGGFAVEIVTNSEDVIAAAAGAWGNCAPEYVHEPVRLRVLVESEGRLAQRPSHRLQGSQYAIVADAHNFAQIDLEKQTGFLCVSRRTAKDHSWLRWFFLESSVYVTLSQRFVVPIHAACIVRGGAGILLSGSSGAGKSSLSYACARAGFTFVTDDAAWLLPETERFAIGQSWRARFRPDAPVLFPELRDYVVRARPNGKIGIEVPLADLPHIRTTSRAQIAAIVFLERGPGTAGTRSFSAAETADRILSELPSYGDDTDAIHERSVRRMAEAPAYAMRYQTLDEGIQILEGLKL